MLLMDGVKYLKWVPQSEEELERFVSEHASEIFSENSMYFDRKLKLQSLSGIGSIPDGYAIVFGDSIQWHIIEVELSSHPLYNHIVPQISRFISGINNLSTQKMIADALFHAIIDDAVYYARVEKVVQTGEIYKFVADLISKPPILTIIIDRDTEELREALNTLRYSQIKVVEFQTFTREGLDLSVHAHLFEPLYKPAIPSELQPPTAVAGSVEITLPPASIKYRYIHIPAARKDLFPSSGTTLELDTDIGVIEAGYYTGPYGSGFAKGLPKWFKAHPELKVGDKLLVTVIEPLKKYRLEILKE